MDERIRRMFSENLRKYMSMGNKTQADLCRYMKVSSATASDWCNGVKMPRADKLQSIANWLGVELSVLLGEKEPTGYYFDPESASLAQEMLDDPDMRALFDMKRNMDPERFRAHMDFMKKLYKQEHPDYDEGC